MATTYLSKTFGSDTTAGRRKWTWSAWVKRSALSTESWLFHAYSNGTNENSIFFDTSDRLCFSIYESGNSNNGRLTSTRKFRDTSAWYHIVVVWDSANSTAADRMILYVNGERLTAFDTNTNGGSNHQTLINKSGVAHAIGRYGSGTYYFNGYMTHVHFSDGYALAPTVFGSTDSTTGEWKINISPTFTLGTNGFTILKDGNTITDQSANSNNWTVGGGTLTPTVDNPSNVFATFNTLATYWLASTFSNGNTTQTTQNSNYAFNTSTLGFQTGKFYWEAKIVSSGQSDMFGITGRTNAGGTTHELGKYSDQYAFNSYSGVSRNNSTDTSYASQFNSNGTIVQIAVDMTNLKIHLGVNGVWQNSSNPSNNTGGLAIGAISTTTDGFYFVGIGDYSNGQGTYSYNFGNGYFGTTAVSSAGTNASGNGIFEYDVPTGFTALSTKGLNL